MADDSEAPDGPAEADPSLPPEFGEALLQQAFDLWLIPEIERRRQAGAIAEDWTLERAQVIFGNGDEPPAVRLNGEVKGTAIVTAARAIEKGEMITLDDSGISDLVRDPEDEDMGHLTILPSPGGGWFISFDFRRNASTMRALADRADGFLATARAALVAGHLAPTAENLFAAVELLAKALLIWIPDESLLRSRTHQTVHRRFNSERRMGNVDPRFADLLNRLRDVRGSARYLRGDLLLDAREAEEMIAVAEEMLEAARAAIPRTSGSVT